MWRGCGACLRCRLAEMTIPMPMTLECEAEITGESLTGTMQLGAFGAAPFTGTRRA